MKKLFACLALLSLGGSAMAQKTASKDGYNIQLKLSNADKQDTIVYLAHYYGKALPTIYKADSSRIDKNGNAKFNSKEKIAGGIYMMLFKDRSTYFEFLLNNGDDLSISANMIELPGSVKVKNSPENDAFADYMKFLKNFGEEQEALQGELKTAKTQADTIKVYDKMRASGKKLTDYRKNVAAKSPSTLLANIFSALEQPQVPEGEHKLPDGTIDSLFGYRYYKDHYWDKFNLQDDRLIYTPMFEARIDEYINKLVMQVEDSVIKESNMLLAKTRGSKEMFKYTLWWLTRNAETSKIMGMDAVFVYLVENYYMKGDAFWLEPDVLQKYIDRASKIAPNVIGNIAPEIKMKDITGKMHSLRDLKAKYTLLLFWSPDCGHCLTEVPKLDSLYEASLKAKGVKVFAIRTEGDPKKWQEVINEKKLNDWTHVYDPEHRSNFRADYDIYSTPVIYLLDEKKIIRGKRLDHSNLGSLVEMLERKEKTTKQ